MQQSRRDLIAQFVEWAGRNVTGDEKGQAQIFLDRLFVAFGQKGLLDAGGAAEVRIKKASEDGGGTAFADCVWKPVVLIEMKKRGVDLRRHYRQAFEYWTRLVPNRPRYVVLCNFDRFDVYDFDNQVDEPVDFVALFELPDRYGPLAFLFPTQESPIFGNDRVKVTSEAANLLAECFNKLKTRKIDPVLRQRFILQCLVALFAEDIGLLEPYTFTKVVEECKTPADSYDLLGDLFQAMDRRDNAGGRYKGVRYFDGGIFAEPARLELYVDEINQLRQAAKSDWSKVSPEIFGTLFQHSMGTVARRELGAHYTSQVDILKIVKPTIVDPWTEAVESARSATRLLSLLERLASLRVLDPACGSGNFLYVAYREMKKLEARIRERLRSEFPTAQATLHHVNARQFFGIDIIPFAIELAKVTMMLGRKLAIDELHILDEADLPLDNLDANFLCTDALVSRVPPSPGTPGEGRGEGPSYIQTPWPPADVIIGNPPFGGAKYLKPAHGADYVNTLRRLYPDVPGMADYCVYWIRRAHDHLPQCTRQDPFAGRAGLVGTQNIRNNQSRVGGLDHVVASGTIVEAVDNQPWSGEANVHVSIVNWVKSLDGAVLPKSQRLWSRVKADSAAANGFRKGCAAKTYELRDRACDNINAALTDRTNVTGAQPLRCNVLPQRSFNGQMIGHKRFVLTRDERAVIVKSDKKSEKVIFPYLNGREALSGNGSIDRFVIDFGTLDQIQAMRFPAAFEWVRKYILPIRKRKAEEGKDSSGKQRSHHKAFLSRWWQLSFGRPELISLIERMPRYLCCSLVTKRAIFFFVSSEIRPSNLLQVFAFDDDYTFGVLQSQVHWQWFTEKSSKLKSDYRFGELVWNTFPWPQTACRQQIDAVAAAGREVRRVREEAIKVVTGGLRAVYRTLELPGRHPLKDAHAALDAAVMDAYGFSARKDLLAQLLNLNRFVAVAEKSGSPVVAPGVPPSYGDPSPLISDDAIRP